MKMHPEMKKQHDEFLARERKKELLSRRKPARPTAEFASTDWVGDETAELWLRAALDAVREIQVKITERMDRYTSAGATMSADAERLAKWELESAAERINNLRYRAAHGQSPTGAVSNGGSL
jgi:hypothetical protein